MKMKSFCKAKDTTKVPSGTPTEWEKVFTNYTSDRGLVSKIYKELKKPDTKESNNKILKWGNDINKAFSIEESQMAEKHF